MKISTFLPRARHMSKFAARHALAGAPMFIEKFPNISSELDSYTGEGSGSFRRGTGATALSNKMTLGYEPGVATLDNSWRTAIFSAQRSNSTFGNSDTVQPSAVRALALIRAY